METRRQTSVDVTAIIIITAFILFGCFGRTVITGKEISKLPALAAEDCFFNSSLRISTPRPRFDPSLYQFHIPFQLYAARQINALHIPLWNPCFGCGFPTVAELQYCTFSPFRRIFQAANPYLYNLGIAVKSLIAALGMFALSRAFRFSTGASSFAAIAYGLCPFVLRELELPNEVQLFPLIAAAFLYLANAKSFAKTALLGACTALALASMHPEFFFLAIVNSLLLLVCARSYAAGLPPMQTGKNVILAGSIGICLGAPLLLPFLELVSNADSYKFHQFTVQSLTVQTLLSGLVSPLLKGGSAFLGVVSLLMAVYAVARQPRKCLRLIILAVGLGLWCSMPKSLENIRALVLIPPRYLLAPFLVSVTLLAAHGIEAIMEQIQARRRKELVFLALMATFLAITPFALISGRVSLPAYDGTLPVPLVLHEEATKGAISLAVSLFILAGAFTLRLPGKVVALLPVFLLAVNLFSLGNSSKLALSPSFAFTFRETATLKRIRESGERMTAHGLFFFSPNISLSYDLRDYRYTGPLAPKWMAALQAAGRNFTKRQRASSRLRGGSYLSTMMDTASVNYIISRWPCYSNGDKPLPYEAFPVLANSPQPLTDLVLLKDGRFCLSENGELFCKFDWQINSLTGSGTAAQIDILDEDGKLLNQSPRITLAKKGQSRSTTFVSIKIPDFPQRKNNVYLVLRLFSMMTEAMLPLDKAVLPLRGYGVELLKVGPETKNFTDLSGARLQFISEDKDQVLLYKNTFALPQAYLTTSVRGADSLSKAVEEMERADFDAHRQTVIEAAPEQLKLSNSAYELRAAEVQRPDAHTVLIKSDCDHEAFLILTDTYYNGWHAYVDGKEVPILRANVNFRAVRVPAGQHQIKFEFVPFLFYFGAAVAAAALSACLFLIVKERAGR